MDTTSTKSRRRQPDYFAQFRPQGDTLRAKAARAQIETDRKSVTLAHLKFMDLPDPDRDGPSS